jgi:uncharacterized protein (TIGR00299 family) protein
MILGALLDLGLPLDVLRSALGSLAIDYGTVAADRVLRAGVSATKFRVHEPAAPAAHARESHVHVGHTVPAGDDDHRQDDHHHGHDHGHHHHHHDHHHDHPDPRDSSTEHVAPSTSHDAPGTEHVARSTSHVAQSTEHVAPGTEHVAQSTSHDAHSTEHVAHSTSHDAHSTEHVAHSTCFSLSDIGRLIDRSALSVDGKARARQLFQRLAEAEAAIHDTPVEQVHLHEVGALDSIIDIVGVVAGMEWVGAAQVASSPLNVGGGTVRCAHGVFPVPAPATTRLLQGVPVYAGEVQRELTTPTGALLVTAYAGYFGPMPAMRVRAVGYGAGDADVPGYPNVLRLILGDAEGTGTAERIVVIECEIDDMNPQLFGPLMDRLLAAGALDVYYAAVQMKKNRPGTLVTVIAPPERREDLSAVLFSDTTTIGVRFHEVRRERLDREVRTLETPVGPIRFKVARRGGRIVNASPEFDDCARAAVSRGLPIKDVQAIAMKAWLEHRP